MKLRPALLRFAEEQERILANNDHKNHWSDMNYYYLVECVGDELDELKNAMMDQDLETAQGECCDIANFAMMIYDNIERGKKK